MTEKTTSDNPARPRWDRPSLWDGGPYDDRPGDDGAFQFEGTNPLGAATVSQGPVQLLPDPLTSRGELFIRVVARRGQEDVWDGIIPADSEEEFTDACQQVAVVTRVSLQAVEQEMARLVTDQRAAWVQAGQRDQGQEGEEDFLANAIDSAAFARARYLRDWLVKPLLVRGQPVIIGGPHKTLKTSVVVDLAVSLGSGRAFLSKFAVPEPVRVLVLSGESGEATLQETAERVCRAKAISLGRCDVVWNFDLPQLNREQDVGRLAAFIRGRQVRVVIIDPLYLCLQGIDLSAANMFTVGPLLRRVARRCQEAGATPVLVHHTGKTAGLQKAGVGAPIDLPDLAYAGFAEFARQWLLVSRRQPFEAGTGMHKLWLNAGGSAGQGGLWGLDVNEGVLNERFGGRAWQVQVLAPDQARAEVQRQQEIKKEEKKEARKGELRGKVLEALLRAQGGETTRQVRELTGSNGSAVAEALADLLRENLVEQTTVSKRTGRGAQEYPGWRLTAAGRVQAGRRSGGPAGEGGWDEGDATGPDQPSPPADAPGGVA